MVPPPRRSRVRYPVKGCPRNRCFPRAGRPARRWPTAAMPSKRPRRLRSADPDGSSPFCADAGRMAGRAPHPFRRCEQRPDHQPRRRLAAQGDLETSSRTAIGVFATNCGEIKGPPNPVGDRPQLLDVARKVVHHQLRLPRSKYGDHPSIHCGSRQLYVQRMAGLDEFDLLGEPSPSAMPAEGGEAHRSLCRHQCRP